jgi:hypothetical protein
MFRRFQTAIFRPSIGRKPEDGGLKTPKHVTFIIDVSNKDIELC